MMNKQAGKRVLSLLLSLIMTLGMLPAAAFAAEDARDSIVVPAKNNLAVSDLINAYELRVVNLNSSRVSIDAGMHVGFPGNNVTNPTYNPAYTDKTEWKSTAFPNRSGYYSTATGVVTRSESNPFAIKTTTNNSTQYVPVMAMVDNANADYLLNARDGSYDFKRWANSLTVRDYDPASPQRGAMVAPYQFYESYVHEYNNYTAAPTHVLAYRANVAPIEEGGWARSMTLLVDAVPYEANALSVTVTGTDYVSLAPVRQDAYREYYDYTGPAAVTVTVTNTASYPVLAQLSHVHRDHRLPHRGRQHPGVCLHRGRGGHPVHRGQPQL